MIKFIASDLDGTLLNEKKELPHDFDEVIDRLNEMGIQFAISSGRQYDAILQQFGQYKDKITIIAENGSSVYEKGKRILCSVMDRADAVQILRDALNEPGLYPIACGVNGAFGAPENETQIQNVLMYYPNYRTVDDVLAESQRSDLLKIAIVDDELSEKHCLSIMKKYCDTHNVVVSGDHWLDVMKKGVTKGSAIEYVQKLHSYSPDECMAFGDFMNDAEMMQVCYHSYAMENAYPALKELCRFEAPSNEDEGVTKTIKKVIFGE